MNKIRFSFLLFILLLLFSCTYVDGHIESYSNVLARGTSSIRYEIKDVNGLIVYRGESEIDNTGDFTFKIQRKYSKSNTLRISGSRNLPSSIIGTTEILLNGEKKKYELGNLYSFDYINIKLGEIDQINDQSLMLYWSSNIPDVDLYKITLMQFDPKKFQFKIILEDVITSNEFNLSDFLAMNKISIESLYVSLKALRNITGEEITIGESEAFKIP